MDDDYHNLVGYVATSKAGRDAGRSFLIVEEVDENYILLVDGTLRKLARPKKKKRKHVQIHGECAENIKIKLLDGKQVFDAEIRNCLLGLGYNAKECEEGEQNV